MFRKDRLENGITVVMEQMRNVRSVSLGIWVKVGSRNERTEKNGISHFLEHMFFKGTKKRSARDIAAEVDSLGGDLNAFTSKEGTTFYIKVLDEYIEEAAEMLADIFLNSTMPDAEIKKEKGVIGEEIKMVEDTPDDYIHELFNVSVWGDWGLGQPILGKKETIKTITRSDLVGHVKKYYGVKDTVVACAGKFKADKLMRLLNKSLGGLRRGSEAKIRHPQRFNAGTWIYGKDLAEAHICLGIQGVPQPSPDRYAMLILNVILGGGLSSRLFQEIREKRGLAYTIYSFLSAYYDTGVWAVYAGTGGKKVEEVIERIYREIKRLPSSISAAELERAKNQLKGNLILSFESTGRMMQNIASQELYYGRYFTPGEIIKEIDFVSLKKARELAGRVISGNGIALAVLGPVSGRLKSTLPPL